MHVYIQINLREHDHFFKCALVAFVGQICSVTKIFKDAGSKLIVFPLDRGVSLHVYNYTLSGDRFRIVVNKTNVVGYVVSDSESKSDFGIEKF